MLVAAAVCPHPPLIVPELAGAAAGELDDLRAACHAALAALLATDHDRLLVVGGADTTVAYGTPTAGTLQPWGVDVRTGVGEPVLPLSLTIGQWLLEHNPTALRLPSGDPRVQVSAVQRLPGGESVLSASGAGRTDSRLADGFHAIAFDADPVDCLASGVELVADRRVAMLVMADGSACLTEKAPGYLDQAAQPYNDQIGRALADADAGALAALDPVKGARLWVGGRAALQVLAGAAGERAFEGRLLAETAPYGVGYFVATWT